MPGWRFKLRKLPVLGLTILVAASSGCRARPGLASPDNTVPLVFANETIDKADVWVVARDIPRRRVGSVLGGETATLRIPKEYYTTGYIGVFAERRDRPQAWGEVYNVEPGEQLRARLPKNGTRLALLRPAQKSVD